MADPVSWRSPGRVNLIGEHTDYNDGFALPMAIAAGCTTTAALGDDSTVRIRSAQRPDAVSVPLAGLAPGAVADWAGYVAGVVWALRERGCAVPGLELSVDGNVPLGAGLSSSAALSCSVVAAVDDLLGLKLDRRDWVAVARRAENDFVGAPTGGMDQLASVHAQAGCALLCDMQSLSTTNVPFDLAGLRLLVIDSKAPHRHADGEYRARREACEQAAALLKVSTLRQVQDRDHAGVLEDLRVACALHEVGDADLLVRRTRHILTENARVLAVVSLLHAGDVAGIGALLSASHTSMRVDFEITAPEVDLAVTVALARGALGARMTGGGFGGCVIALVPAGSESAVAEAVAAAFADAGFTAPEWFTVEPSQGTHRLV